MLMLDNIRSKIAGLIAPQKKSYTPSRLTPTFSGIDDIFCTGGDYSLLKYRSVAEQIEAWEFLSVPYRVISDTAARLVDFPLKLYRGEAEVQSHPVIDMMRNPNDSGQTFDGIRFELWCYYLITGNSYLYVPRGVGTNNPIGDMWVRYSQYVEPGMRDRKKIYDYTGNEEYFLGPQGHMQIPDSEMIHHKTFNPHSQIKGISPIQHAAHSVEMQKVGMRWNVEVVRRALKIPGIISFNRAITDESVIKSLRRDFRENFEKNPGSPALFFSDASYTPITYSGNDIDFIEGRKMDMRDICGTYKYPYKLVLPNDGAALSENEMNAMYSQWYDGVIIPMLKGECKRFSRFFFPDGSIEFRPDYMASRQYVSIAAENLKSVDGITSATPNEKRKMAGLPELDIPEADKLYFPSNMLPIDELGMATTPELTDLENL